MTAADPAAFTGLPDLAVRTLGGSVVYANDELYAERENLITPAAAVFAPQTRCISVIGGPDSSLSQVSPHRIIAISTG